MFNNDKPSDWLLLNLVHTKVCRFDKSAVSEVPWPLVPRPPLARPPPAGRPISCPSQVVCRNLGECSGLIRIVIRS